MTKLLGIFLLLLFNFSVSAQSNKDLSKEQFKVFGNCEMCKKTIDAAAKSVDGVASAKWNAVSKQMKLKFDSSKTDIISIKKAIAKAGYDTEEFRAEETAYNSLHYCCQYDRPEALKE